MLPVFDNKKISEYTGVSVSDIKRIRKETSQCDTWPLIFTHFFGFKYILTFVSQGIQLIMRYEIEKTDNFGKWLNSRKIISYKNRLLARFERIKNGNFGDFKPIITNLFELRFFFGDGLRVYYTFKNNEVVLLLAGGDKSSQKKDIEKAKQLIENVE